MASAKDLIVKPIKAADANRLVKKMHYSGKVVPNSQLHLGVFWQGHIEGVMSFGPPINKKGTINIVARTTPTSSGLSVLPTARNAATAPFTGLQVLF
jgi:hypothetical protein